MSDIYAREKFDAAVEVLATSPETIQERLNFAYLTFHPVQIRDFSDPEDAALYIAILEALTTVKNGDPDQGYVKNTLAVMSAEKASKVADDIVALRNRLEAKRLRAA